MLSNILHNALGETVRGTAAWGKPGTTNVCVLTLTSWILCPPGKNVDVFTFRQSCAAPACCSMLRTSLLVQVSHKYSVLLFNCYCMIFQMLTYLYFAIIFYYILLKSRCQWVLYPNVSADEPTAWGYLCDLLSALEHLHSRGFVHLDLKPANVLVTSSGRLKLGDFGLLLELKHTTGDAMEENVKDDMQEGDPRYMAPELLRGEYGPAADVFRYGSKLTKYLKCAPSKLHSNWHINGFSLSLGVTILELACNIEIPNGGEGWQQLRQGCLPSEFTSCKIHLLFIFFIHFCLLFCFFLFNCLFTFAGLSGELQSVLQMMLNPNPSERPTVSELLSLPSVWKYRWKRRIYLFLTEAAQTLASICQVHSCTENTFLPYSGFYT